MSRKESWRLKASKLREKAVGVGDRDMAATTMMMMMIMMIKALSAMDKKCDISKVLVLLFAKAPERNGHLETPWTAW